MYGAVPRIAPTSVGEVSVENFASEAALFGSAALATVGDATLWIVPRTLAAFAVAVAGVVMMGWRGTPYRAIKAVMTVCLAALAVSYIGASNRILADQRRVNQWDAQLVNRVIGRIESDSEFQSVRSIAIVGTYWPYTAAIPTWIGDMNTPAPVVRWAQLGLVEQTTGYRLVEPTGAEWEVASGYCDSAPLWPKLGSTAIIDSLAVVCFTRPA